MQKKRLDKLFYGDRETYEQEYRRRFDDPDTYHLPIQIGEHPAFFYVTPQMLNQVATIERTDKMVFRIAKVLPGAAIKQFIDYCLIGEIMLTNNIEGVHSTRKDIEATLQNLAHEDKKRRFEGLVRKYHRLGKNDDIPLKTSQDVRNVYDGLFSDEIGSMDEQDLPDGEIFRKGTVGVHSASDKKIHSGLYPESRIIDTMDHALEFLHDDSVDILIRIAVFHYLFGYIHPFYDGNGRTSRFISSYLLSQHLHPLMGYRISYTVKEHIRGYYEAFKICNDSRNRGDLTPFIEMFLGIIETAELNLLQALETRREKMQYYNAMTKKLPYSDKIECMWRLYFLLAQAALFSENGVTQELIEKYMKKSSVDTQQTAKMLQCIPTDMLEINRRGEEVFYKLDLDVVDAYLLNIEN